MNACSCSEKGKIENQLLWKVSIWQRVRFKGISLFFHTIMMFKVIMESKPWHIGIILTTVELSHSQLITVLVPLSCQISIPGPLSCTVLLLVHAVCLSRTQHEQPARLRQKLIEGGCKTCMGCLVLRIMLSASECVIPSVFFQLCEVKSYYLI